MMKTFAALLFLVAFCQGYESNVDAEDGASEKSSPPISGQCPGREPVARCLVNPCLTAKCRRFPQAICKPNPCKNCRPEFFLRGRKIPFGQCKKSNCPLGQRLFACLVNPCKIAKCPKFPNAICKLSFCGGCKAEFFIGQRKISAEKCASVCPVGQPPVQCKTNPCLNAKCEQFPQAKCRPDYCGGCRAKFYFGNFEIPDEKCRVCPSNLVPTKGCKRCIPVCPGVANKIAPHVYCHPKKRCFKCACPKGKMLAKGALTWYCTPINKCPAILVQAIGK